MTLFVMYLRMCAISMSRARKSFIVDYVDASNTIHIYRIWVDRRQDSTPHKHYRAPDLETQHGCPTPYVSEKMIESDYLKMIQRAIRQDSYTVKVSIVCLSNIWNYLHMNHNHCDAAGTMESGGKIYRRASC